MPRTPHATSPQHARRTLRPHRAVARAGLGLAIGATSLAWLPAAPAGASPATVPGPVSVTATGAFSGTVPDGVCAVQAEVLGGAGGSSLNNEDSNGSGARISATYAVVPGQTYAGSVGGGGQQGRNQANGQGAGGLNGGGAGGTAVGIGSIYHPGAGGGGWSQLDLGGRTVVVAGGGGGASGGHATDGGDGGDGGLATGAGVTPGSDGTAGFDSPAASPGGGQGGQAAGPGAGGAHSTTAALDGSAGSGRTGGNGGADPNVDTGAGGGGGWFGGGGGASTTGNGSGTPVPGGVGGGGGGGGASFVAATAADGDSTPVEDVSSAAGPKLAGTGNGADGSVTLTWVPCRYDLSVVKTVTPETGPTGTRVTWTVRVTNTGPDPMTRGDLVTLTDTLPGGGTTEITSISTFKPSPAFAPALLPAGEVTCTAAVGDPMPGTLTCSRDYSAPGAGDAPTGGDRGLDVNETLTVTYTQQVSGAVGSTMTNTATVDDRTTGDSNDSATATYTFTPPPPTANPDRTSGPQGLPQSIDPLANDDAGDPSSPIDPSTLTLLDGNGDPATSVTVDGQGTYTIDGDGRIVFTPLRSFVGEATPVDYRVADQDGLTATSTYTPTLTAVTPGAVPDSSSGAQGAPQSADPLDNDEAGDDGVPLDPATLTLLDGDGDPVTTLTVPGEGTYTLAAGRITFQPVPDFVGEATPVDYRVADENGTTTSSTYTPTVTPVAAPDTTTGPQGIAQRVDPLANDDADADVVLDPDTLRLVDPVTGDPVDTVTVDGQGTYTVDGGDLVFTPLPGFTGVATAVSYLADDADGNTVGSTYTPTVTPVDPGANPDVSSGPQGLSQSVDPLTNDLPGDDGVPLDPDTLTLLDGNGDPATSVTVDGEGTYTINGAGRIVFVPLPTFVGEATPVGYRVADANGTPTISTYTPTVTAVTPEATPDTSSGPQGRSQSVDPLANDTPGNPDVPLDAETLTLLDGNGDPATSVTVDGEGTYTINGAGRIVFTPLPTFVGEATPVDYRVADTNGTTTTSTYTPTVTGVVPVARPDTTSGPIDEPQSVDPFANDDAGDADTPLDLDSLTLLDSDGDAVTSVTVPGEGTYTVSGRRIVFTPVRGFTGEATPVGYRIADANGTTATSTYTPTVRPATELVGSVTETAPVGSPVTLDPVSDVPGLVPGSVRLLTPDGDRVLELVVPGEGTWVVDPVTGKVTFTPEPGFTGDPTPVRYVGQKSDGTPVRGRLVVHYTQAPTGGSGNGNGSDDGSGTTGGGMTVEDASSLADTGASPWLLPMGAAGAAAVLAGLVLVRRRRLG